MGINLPEVQNLPALTSVASSQGFLSQQHCHFGQTAPQCKGIFRASEVVSTSSGLGPVAPVIRIKVSLDIAKASWGGKIILS